MRCEINDRQGLATVVCTQFTLLHVSEYYLDGRARRFIFLKEQFGVCVSLMGNFNMLFRFAKPAKACVVGERPIFQLENPVHQSPSQDISWWPRRAAWEREEMNKCGSGSDDVSLFGQGAEDASV